jgi:hypothetical protein
VTKVQDVTLSVSLNNFNKEIDPFGVFSNSDSEIQAKFFLFLYVTFFFTPHIKFLKDSDLGYRVSFLFSERYFFINFTDLYVYLHDFILSKKIKNKKELFVFNSSFFYLHGLKKYLKDILSVFSVKNLEFLMSFNAIK